MARQCVMWDDIPKVNSSRLTFDNYGPKDFSPLPPFSLRFSKDGGPYLEQSVYALGVWGIVGKTKNPLFDCIIISLGWKKDAVLYERYDGALGWWHVIDPEFIGFPSPV